MNGASRPCQFLLVGDVGGETTFHLGDEAMLQANVERLKELFPGAQITVASHDPTWTSRLYEVKAVPRLTLTDILAATQTPDLVTAQLVSSAHEALTGTGGSIPGSIPESTLLALAEADGLLISGGGNLNNTWLHQLYERVFLITLAHRLNCPVVVTGQTLGPHFGQRERKALREALIPARLVSVREPYSMLACRALGLAPERTMLHLDDAFFRPRTATSKVASTGLEQDRWIAVTVTQYPGSLGPLASQLGRIARHTGCRLVFVPHVKSPDGDMEVADRIVELLEPSVAADVLDVPPSERGRWLVEHAALVVSLRYHPLVFAVAGGVPALGVYTDEYTRVKLRGALGHAGLQDWAISLDTALCGGLADAALELWDRREAIERHLISQMEGWRVMEAGYRTRLAGELAGDSQADAPADTYGPSDTTWWDEIGNAPCRPRGAWSETGRALERRRDVWFRERIDLLEQVDDAVEHAQNLEVSLAECDRQLSDLRELERSRDEWSRERVRLLQQVDSAVEYAQSLEATLAERDRELLNLKEFIRSR